MKLIAAMSGGVDSAVAAARAVEAGHDVIGVHLALQQTLKNIAQVHEDAAQSKIHMMLVEQQMSLVFILYLGYGRRIS